MTDLERISHGEEVVDWLRTRDAIVATVKSKVLPNNGEGSTIDRLWAQFTTVLGRCEEAPFTVQRLCELALLGDDQQYDDAEKYLNALIKVSRARSRASTFKLEQALSDFTEPNRLSGESLPRTGLCLEPIPWVTNFGPDSADDDLS